MIILAFDPGKTTGYVVLDSVASKIYVMNSFPLTRWQHIEKLITTMAPTVVVIEQFKLYPGAAKHKVWSDFPTVQVIGVIRYLAEKHNIPVVMQSAADIKVINLVYSKQKKGDRHAYAALRHALLYLRKQGQDGEFKALYKLRSGRTRGRQHR